MPDVIRAFLRYTTDDNSFLGSKWTLVPNLNNSLKVILCSIECGRGTDGQMKTTQKHNASGHGYH